ncbi:MAG: prolyl oligopeptidase family serine peptidase [Woeseiaceae bacterium]
MSVFSLLSFFTSAKANKPFGIDDYLALQSISEISVSPDGPNGQFVAYTVTSSDLKKDETHDVVWMQPTDGAEPLRMTSLESNASSPKWSPDGRYLSVLSDRIDETSQVWLLDRRGGDAQQLTDFKQGIDSYDWAPDSNSLLLLVADPSPEDLDEEEPPNPRPYVVDRLQFKEDYVGYLTRHRMHVHVIDVASAESRQVTFGDFDDSEPAWSPDSQRIVFVSNRTETPDRNRNTDLWIVDVDSAGAEPTQLTTHETADASPSWSPDGRTIIYTSTVPDAKRPIYAIPQLTVVDIETGKSAVNPSLSETQVFYPRYAPDGQSLLAITEYHGEQHLVRVETESGAVQSLIEGSDVVTEFDVAADGTIYPLVTQPQLPDEIFVFNDGDLTQLSFVNKDLLDSVALATTEKHNYQSKDGTNIDAFYVFPSNYKKGKAYPAILYIHGGPQQQWDYRFDVEAQMLAAKGYVVVLPNPRGSWGYGQEFAQAIFQDWGGPDYEDVMAGMDFGIEQGWIDADHMAVYGWSYGGMLTNHVITKTERFKAAITVASATLYIANYGHDQYQRWWEEELGLPWLPGNREKYDRMSPFYSLDKVTTPTLIVGGQDDWNVPIQNSEQLYIVLKRLGIPTELVVYPDQGHTWEDVPSYEKDLYERYFVWLERHVSN